MKKILFAFLSITLFGVGCTPKVAEDINDKKEVKDTVAVVTPVVEDNLSPCKKFSDAPNPDQAETDYVLYRGFLQEGDWEKSFELWKKVYQVAPAADGRRSNVFLDGVQFYEHFLSEETDSIKRAEYIDNIFRLYDEIIECYPREKGETLSYKAFDLYYSYKGRMSEDELFELFKEIIDLQGNKTPDFIVSTFTSMLIDFFDLGKISMETAKLYDPKIREILVYGLAHCEENDDCADWKNTNEYVLSSLTFFETVSGFYDCDYFTEKYYPYFEENKEDCGVIVDVYSRLKFGNCDETQPQFANVIAYAKENCAEKGKMQEGIDALKAGKYKKAIALFKEAAEQDQYKDRRPDIFLLIAKVYYGHLRQFSNSRKYARKAAGERPKWGAPFILIGNLYASSGPLCGPGRGWDSQIVVWPAVDMWKHAKAIDPSSAKVANKWINQYSQFMPSKEDIFQRNLKTGDSFHVGCWINERTVVRPGK